MTVNSTLAHSAIKSLRHAQECMIAIDTNNFLPTVDALSQYILVLESLIINEIQGVATSEEIERGE